MAVDGVANTVHEVDAVRVPTSPENPYGNAFTRTTPRSTSGRRSRPRACG
ncbi:hypothetical protein [Modestobacter sp. SYSU DS0875]